MQLQIFGECMILIINYLLIKDKIIGKKNAQNTLPVLIAKSTEGNIVKKLIKTDFRSFSSV
jgi:hypothetical protein